MYKLIKLFTLFQLIIAEESNSNVAAAAPIVAAAAPIVAGGVVDNDTVGTNRTKHAENNKLILGMKLWPNLGVLAERIDTELLFVNGDTRLDLNLRFALPKIIVPANSTCSARDQNPSGFDVTVNTANTNFKNLIKSEIEEFLGTNISDSNSRKNVDQNNSNENDSVLSVILKDLSICDAKAGSAQTNRVLDNLNIKCEFKPTLVPAYGNDAAQYGGSWKNEYYPVLCSRDSDCNSNVVNSFCCDRSHRKNDEKTCPLGIADAQKEIAIYIRAHGNKILHLGADSTKRRARLRAHDSYCVTLTKIKHYSNEDIFIKNIYKHSYLKEEKDGYLWNGHMIIFNSKRRRRKREIQIRLRRKRSIYSWALNGFGLGGVYTDVQMQKANDIEKSDYAALKAEINKNDLTILKLEGANLELNRLRSSVCRFASEMNPRIYLLELRQAYSRLEYQMDMSMLQCMEGNVPLTITNSHLRKFCIAASQSKVCDTVAIRALFSCALVGSHFDSDQVVLKMNIIFRHPIDEDKISSYRIRTIGVPYKYGSLNRLYNTTKTKPAHGEDNLEMAYHYLKITGLPQYVSTLGQDTLGFPLESCDSHELANKIKICDYARLDDKNSECVKTILFDSTNLELLRLKCEIQLESSNFPCRLNYVKTQGAYLVSSHKPVRLYESAESNSIFNGKSRITKCINPVCLISPEKTSTRFTCAGHRTFKLPALLPNENIQINTAAKIKGLNLADFRIRKSNLESLNEIAILDKLIPNAWNHNHFTSLSNILTVIFLIFILILILIYLKKKVMKVWIKLKSCCCRGYITKPSVYYAKVTNSMRKRSNKLM